MTKKLMVMLATAALVSVACTVHQTEAPALVGPSTFAVAPPPDTPTPRFTMSPDKPTVGQQVLFDATSSCPGPELDETNCRPSSNRILSSVWDFGDGKILTGATVTHPFSTPRFYAVTLKVTNDRGSMTSTTKTVEVSESEPPSAGFGFSPTDPEPGNTVIFTETSKFVPGRTNVFGWNFGDPNSSDNEAIGNTVSHRYAGAGSFVVTLVVLDDLKQRAVAQQTVNVKAKTGTTTASVSVTSLPNR
jgi:PKD repeat protein